jgi:hypothetical protein
MKVSELIAELQKVDNQDAEVYIWLDGDRWAINPDIPVDDQLSGNIIDINLKEVAE